MLVPRHGSNEGMGMDHDEAWTSGSPGRHANHLLGSPQEDHITLHETRMHCTERTCGCMQWPHMTMRGIHEGTLPIRRRHRPLHPSALH